MKVLQNVPSEYAEQQALARWLDCIGVVWFHVPNEGRHKVQYRVKQAAIGVKKGVPDILILTAPPAHPHFRGCAIEMKRQKGGALTDSQRYWLEMMERLGWAVTVSKGSAAAIKWLTEEMGYRLSSPHRVRRLRLV